MSDDTKEKPASPFKPIMTGDEFLAAFKSLGRPTSMTFYGVEIPLRYEDEEEQDE